MSQGMHTRRELGVLLGGGTPTREGINGERIDVTTLPKISPTASAPPPRRVWAAALLNVARSLFKRGRP